MKTFIYRLFLSYTLYLIPYTLYLIPYTFSQSLQDAIKLTESEQFEKASAAYLSLIQREPTQGDHYFFYGENYFKEFILSGSPNRSIL